MDGSIANDKLQTWLTKAATATMKRELQVFKPDSPELEIEQAAERIINRSVRDRGNPSQLRCYTPFLKPWQIQNLIQWLQQKDAV